MDFRTGVRLLETQRYGSESALTSEEVDLRPRYKMRVWEIGKHAGVRSVEVLRLLRAMGRNPKSASSKVEVEAFEVQAMVAHLKKRSNR